jgi:hypothetical protein
VLSILLKSAEQVALKKAFDAANLRKRKSASRYCGNSEQAYAFIVTFLSLAKMRASDLVVTFGPTTRGLMLWPEK